MYISRDEFSYVSGLPFSQVSLMQKRVENMQTVLDYATKGEGPLTSFGGVEGLAFINTKYANLTIDQPDIELHFLSGNPVGGENMRKVHGLTEEFYKTVFEPIIDKDMWSVVPVSNNNYVNDVLRSISTASGQIITQFVPESVRGQKNNYLLSFKYLHSHFFGTKSGKAFELKTYIS